MISALISRLVILAFGTLYPAYASYKAVRTKDVKEYVKWMMYWIVFALFTCAETFTDVLFSFWFPFYYELKIAIVIWLLSPATKGSSFLYKTFVHPAFLKREDEIDEMLAKAKERGYSTVMRLGSQGVTYATNVILQTAMKGGGGLVDHIRKSYSLTDLGPKRGDRFLQQDETDHVPEEEEEVPPMPVLRRRPAGPTTVDMRFKEVDVNLRQFRGTGGPLGDIQSNEDISSGYSSTDQLFSGQSELALSRSSSVTSRGRGRPTRATQPKRAPLTEETEDAKEGDASCEPFYDSYPGPDPCEVPFKVSSIIRRFSGQEQFSILKQMQSVAVEKDVGLLLTPELGTLNDSQTSLLSSSSDKSERKGKYGKLPAPLPPTETLKCDETMLQSSIDSNSLFNVDEKETNLINNDEKMHPKYFLSKTSKNKSEPKENKPLESVV